MLTATKAGDTPGLSHLRIEYPVFASEPWHLGLKTHDVEIKDDEGKTIFLQRDVVAPAAWSERAVRVAASKYLYGDPARGSEPSAGGREPSIIDLHSRVAYFIMNKGLDQGVFSDADEAAHFSEELLGITLGQFAAFNSPVWFNAGLDAYGIEGNDKAWAWDDDMDDAGIGRVRKIRDTVKYPQCSACFIQSVGDDMESLMRLARNEAMLFKHGSGTGTDFSTIRSKKEKLRGGGTPSGPISFMRIFDRVASVVKSGGKTRRAAKMQTMNSWHPDIMEFIRVKGQEEKKAKALIAMGWDANFNGEAYDTVAFQNANFSVRVDGVFMKSLRVARQLPIEEKATWSLHAVTTGQEIERIDPEDLWMAIAEETWACGDPGIQFDHTINLWHTCPRSCDGLRPTPINSSNPCSEYLFIDDSACNLASINLMRFQRPDGSYDVEKLKQCVRVMIAAMEILVDASSYPTRAIAQNARDFRPLGLGFANLGGLLQVNGIGYGSETGRQLGGVLASIICGEAYATSALLAKRLGPFAGYRANANSMRFVIEKHANAQIRLSDAIDRKSRGTTLARQLPELAIDAEVSWAYAVELGETCGFRNAQATVIAPTGTIAFMMDCDTTGIEPNLALRAWKTLAGGGGMWVVNRLVPESLRRMGYAEHSIGKIVDYIDMYGTVQGCRHLLPDDVPIFDCSLSPPGFDRVLGPDDHLLMMAAVQPFVSGGISKTVNVPACTTVGQIAALYEKAEDLGLKCVAIYRDASKSSQPLTPRGNDGRHEECKKCGSVNIVPAGTCGVCTECGEPTGGCG